RKHSGCEGCDEYDTPDFGPEVHVGTPFGSEVPPSVLAERGPQDSRMTTWNSINARVATTHCDGRFRRPYAGGPADSIYAPGNAPDLRRRRSSASRVRAAIAPRPVVARTGPGRR